MDPFDSSFNPDVRTRLTAARLPVLPELLVKLMECCQSDEMNMVDIAALIAMDVGMSCKVFAHAGTTARYSVLRPVSLEEALIRLGNDGVRTLLISESVLQAFNHSPAMDGADLRGFWTHALWAALAARMIAVRIGYSHVEEAYYAGLLHNVGRLLLQIATPDESCTGFHMADIDTLHATDQHSLPIKSADAGADLIERWHLDSLLSDSVRYCDQPAACLEKVHPLIRIAFLANRLSRHGQDNDALAAAGSLCGVTVNDLVRIGSDAAEQVAKIALDLGIDLTGTNGFQSAAPRLIQAPAQERLSEKMHELVLASEARRAFSSRAGESCLLEAATQSATLLLDFGDAFVLLRDEMRHVLQGTTAGRHGRRGAELSIPLDGPDVIAQAALQQRPAYIRHDGHSPGIAVEQLRRMLAAECLVCVPLVAAGFCHGVMIGGADARQLAGIQRRESLLHAFGAEVATAYRKIRTERGDASRKHATVTEQFTEAARKAAHEINNPLSILKNYLSVLGRKLEKHEPVAAEISILNDELDRIARIVDRFGDLPAASPEGPTEIYRVVNDVVRMFRQTEFAPPSVRIVARMHEMTFDIDGDADTLKQILINLIKNAIEALPGSGEITIGCNGLANRDGMLHAALWIRDNGPGIPADRMASLFSSGQSTKGEEHRGLGLSIVHLLVKKLHGAITCHSDGKGTTFELLLPGRIGQARAPRPGAETTAMSP